MVQGKYRILEKLGGFLVQIFNGELQIYINDKNYYFLGAAEDRIKELENENLQKN